MSQITNLGQNFNIRPHLKDISKLKPHIKFFIAMTMTFNLGFQNMNQSTDGAERTAFIYNSQDRIL